MRVGVLTRKGAQSELEFLLYLSIEVVHLCYFLSIEKVITKGNILSHKLCLNEFQ